MLYNESYKRAKKNLIYIKGCTMVLSLSAIQRYQATQEKYQEK